MRLIPPTLPKPHVLVALLCSFCALLLYVACLSPTVTYTGDCGELIAASYTGGVAHPSGYPLFCILGRAFAFLPIGEIAWRYNFFSAVCGAATVGVVASLVTRLTLPQEYSTRASFSQFWPAIFAALLLAGFSFFGAQCVIAEAYALNAFLIAAIFYSAVAWRQERRFRWLFALALLLGLSFNSHLSIVFVWSGVLWLLLPLPFSQFIPQIKTLGTQKVALLLAAFLIGFSFTLYLPLRARTFPEPQTEVIAGQEYSWFAPQDWGHPVDFARWKTHVTVGQYKSLLWKPLDVSIGGRTFHLKQLTQTPAQAAAKFFQWCALVAIQLLWSTPLLLVGALAAFRLSKNSKTLQCNDADTNESTPRIMNWRLGACLLLTFVLNVGVAVNYDVDNVFDIANFLFPAYIVLAIWLGLGANALLRAAKDNARVLALCRIALLGAVVCQWFLFTQTASFRGNTVARDLALERADAAQQLQKISGRAPVLFFVTDDTLFPFWYVQKVLKRAPQGRTPWGLPVREYARLGQWPQLVARFQVQGPVAVAQWNEAIDRRFPYTSLNESGSLWLASLRTLPEAAKAGNKSTPRARLARARVRRVETIGLNVQFPCPTFAAQKPLAIDKANRTRQIGWIEVLAAPRDLRLVPTPNSKAELPIIKQSRRLVVANSATAGQLLETLLPMQFPIEARPGEYELWVRTVRNAGDRSTPWRSGEAFQIVVK